MGRAGLFDEDDRVELIEGEIITMTPVGKRHTACVNRLVLVFHRHFLERFLISVQNPVHLSEKSEPQPDVALLKMQPDFYASEGVTAKDVELLIEVGETSVDADRKIKAALYARHGIPELWIIDLAEQLLEVQSDPSTRGYRQVRRYITGELIEWNGESLSVDEILA